MIGVSVHKQTTNEPVTKMAFYSRLFESVEFCLNRACIALAILTLRELLDLFKMNKGIYTKIVDRHVTKGKPRAVSFAASTDVRCKSPEYRGYWEC